MGDSDFRPPGDSSSQETRLNCLSYGIEIWTDLSSVLSQFTRVTDRRTDGRTEFSYRVCITCSAVKSKNVKTKLSKCNKTAGFRSIPRSGERLRPLVSQPPPRRECFPLVGVLPSATTNDYEIRNRHLATGHPRYRTIQLLMINAIIHASAM